MQLYSEKKVAIVMSMQDREIWWEVEHLKVFVICPVANLTGEKKLAIEQHIAELESKGVKVHWPPRDTPQDDPVGYNICCANRDAIKSADEVHIFWNSTSRGSLFDFGMAFALRKTIRLINDPTSTPKKSFENVLRHIAGVKQ